MINYNALNSHLEGLWLNPSELLHHSIDTEMTKISSTEFKNKDGIKICKETYADANFLPKLGLSFITFCIKASEIGVEINAKNRKKQTFRTKNNKEIYDLLVQNLTDFIKSDIKHIPSHTIYVCERHFSGIPHLHGAIFFPAKCHEIVEQKAREKWQNEKAVGTKFKIQYLTKTMSKDSESHQKQYNTARVSGVQNTKIPHFLSHRPRKVSTRWTAIGRILEQNFKPYFRHEKRNKKERKKVIDRVVKSDIFLTPATSNPPKIEPRSVNRIDLQVKTKNGKRIHINRALIKPLTPKNGVKVIKIIRKKGRKFNKKATIRQLVTMTIRDVSTIDCSVSKCIEIGKKGYFIDLNLQLNGYLNTNMQTALESALEAKFNEFKTLEKARKFYEILKHDFDTVVLKFMPNFKYLTKTEVETALCTNFQRAKEIDELKKAKKCRKNFDDFNIDLFDDNG
ncbi:hypothetical protein [Campylobacter geochelonis]|uniref:Uncharacterized protein n=1 Tax=Campylobacter geochelonis TaxID=1780362 RepID=A0A128EHY6_9BACT|nr:hypothetical protein [Campylobacter geochelonis]QKF71919.1 hypothetical protein CGEO_1645 [Campylobacter geochelonis]CZE47873.1 Uncharacterised protein [Campylobacter geochelonis]